MGHSILALGIAYLLALLAGRFANRLRIPKVTLYILLGLILGESLSGLLGYPPLLDHHITEKFKILTQIALAFILVAMGGQFKNESLKRWGKRLVIASATEILFVFALVFLSFFATNVFLTKIVIDPGFDLVTNSLILSLLLGNIAIATAPAVTLLVIREYEADGPNTELVLSLVGQNNLFAIIMFNFLIFLIFGVESKSYEVLVILGLPVLVGVLSGFFVSVWAQRLEKQVEYLLLITAAVLLNVGLSMHFNLDLFLICFSMGIIIVNASPKAAQLFGAVRTIDYPFYVIFFIIAGTHLHVEQLSLIGILGVLYIVARSAAKMAGNFFGTKWGGFNLTAQRWTGLSMLAHGGVAIGLSQKIAATWPEGGQFVQTVIMGAVIVFEILGPLSLRFALVKAGEVPIISLLAKSAPEGTFEGLYHVVDHFRSALGIPRHHKIESASDILVQHIMRKNVETICEDANFNEILRQVSHSKYDRFPVVNKSGQFIGLIDYEDIRDLVVDPAFARLVVAKDIVKPEPLTLTSNQTIGDALDVFRSHSNITYLPVVDQDDPGKLVGIISQNDVLASFRTLEKAES